MDWVSIGSLTIPASWAAMVLAFLLTFIFLYIRRDKVVADWYGNAIFIFIFTWKLSVVLFQLKLTISNPLNILYFNGGIKGYWLGLAVAIIYTVFKRKSDLERSGYALSWLLTVVFYEAIYGFFIGDSLTLIVIQLIVGIGFLVAVIYKSNQIQLLILFIGVQGLAYSIKNELLSTTMATYFIVTVFIIMIVKAEVRND
ncbi:hypothetical protein [Lederbergia citrea]|uniref:Uncharacterized protein n=1 Tax=Lederbergia citrea TaxID=2833581 RepID=A0A942UUI3_9BACI|nr:hypothetical protein [Lederbergia citrea]MBS4223149.1 hypothetical protein [Lederbergia citrea]